MRLSPRLVKARAADLFPAFPLLFLYGLGVAGILLQVAQKVARLTASFPAALGLEILSEVATAIYLAVQITLFVIRRLPEARSRGAAPILSAVAGSISPLLFLVLPRAPEDTITSMMSMILIILGTVGATYALAGLGRSFSILPQARGLVTRGPYRFIRHPLYLTEQISTFGVMFQFAQPWSLLIALGSFVPQLLRMHYEEVVLAKTYPLYRAYVRTTSRLIPGIY